MVLRFREHCRQGAKDQLAGVSRHSRRPLVTLREGFSRSFHKTCAFQNQKYDITRTLVCRSTSDSAGQAMSPVEPTSKRNPAWTRDELILALELYLRNPVSPPSKTSAAVQDLSAVLNRLGELLGRSDYKKFRNPNGVYMKMMNFRRFEAAYTAAGKVGLTRGNKDEQALWNAFAADKHNAMAKLWCNVSCWPSKSSDGCNVRPARLILRSVTARAERGLLRPTIQSHLRPW
jgi:hypothetical protein